MSAQSLELGRFPGEELQQPFKYSACKIPWLRKLGRATIMDYRD